MTADLDKHLKRVAITQASQPKSGLHNVIVNSWWVVTPDDELLFYTRGGMNTPQCNPTQSIAEHIGELLYPEFEVRQIPVVFVPINPRDYCSPDA